MEKDNLLVGAGLTREEIIEKMDHNLTLMERAVERGLNGVKSQTGLTVSRAEFLVYIIGQWKENLVDYLVVN